MGSWVVKMVKVVLKPGKKGPSGASYNVSNGTIKHAPKGSDSKVKVKGRMKKIK